MIRVVFFSESVEKYLKKNPLPRHQMGYTAEARTILKLLETTVKSVRSTIHQLLPEWETMTAVQFRCVVENKDAIQTREGRTILVIMQADEARSFADFQLPGLEIQFAGLDENLEFKMN
jgi:hypothetical protein